MKSKSIVAVGFRLYAIWLGVSALQLLLASFAFERQSMMHPYGASPWLGWLLAAAFGLAALIVWALSGWIAARMLAGVTDEGDARITRFDFVVIGCVLMGLWWLKESVVPFAGLWLKAFVNSPELGKSAFNWLLENAKVTMLTELLQISLALVSILRASSIAKWILRHVPHVPDIVPERPEPFENLLRRLKELGLRQVARRDIVAKLVEQVATHPDAYLHLEDLTGLLHYEANSLTRSASARVIARLGSEAARKSKNSAITRLADEESPEVKGDLTALVALAAVDP
ncbi:hypothetical protein [Rhodanobacter sp. DHG33]|uniref:hypothetical protein n=1 Tax=Rhodanobacter sp. DHG33 TaxID=2775921 RepID=UPI00177DFE8E|nr:hypothetical protein [Rhodanobacter sp. DHG33]MBD8897830.1 hypothetical protein [Rhodanobacter sp. DHG33]